MRRTGSDSPFLSVIVRTQGNRPSSFVDSLLCLAAQTNDDFELIVIAHKVNKKILKQIEETTGRFAPLFRRNPQIIQCNLPGRSSPLNAGVEVAGGRYLAFYDDDDLLFGNWVENFKSVSEKNQAETLLRQLCFVQHVASEKWSLDQGFRAISWPTNPYPLTFSLADHLSVNKSPFMSVAFPQRFFSEYGFRFDSELTVCEDWDAILQCANHFGARSVSLPGSIYRMWSSAETSYSLHDAASWRASEARVIEKLNAEPLNLPKGSASDLHKKLLFVDQVTGHSFLFDQSGFRKPFLLLIRLVSPLLRLMVKIRNKYRKFLSKVR